MAIESGQTLLHYRLIEKIGEGGMGVVWRALDTSLDRVAAIKILPEVLAQDPERLSRFEREAKLLATLNHPNIAGIYGFHKDAGTSFLAMELVEGEDLSQRLARGPLPVEEALEVCRQIAEALESAHERGIVHRDLKPANVKLTPDGKVKVLDFGLAKAISPEMASGSSDPSLSPTMTSAGTVAGMILGTAAYMSPEQARGKPLDRRTDLWSFGCVMHECLTGLQLFRGETISDSLAAILRKDLDETGLPEATPPMVRRLLVRCLTRDPRKRLQDAGDARVELEQAIEDPAGGLPPAAHTAPPASTRNRWLPWAVAAAAALLAIFFAMQGGAPPSEPREARRLTIPVPGPTTYGDLAASPPVISPDGRLVVFGCEHEGEETLWLRPLDGFEARPLPGTEEAQFAFWSPDSRHVAFFTGGKLRRIELATGRVQPIGGVGSSYPRGGSWNDRGQIIYAPNSNTGIWVIDDSGGEPRQITTPDPDVPDSSHRWPWFLPGGEQFLYTLWTNNLKARQQHGGIYVASLSNPGEPRRLVSDASSAIYAPSGHLLVMRGENLVALPVDLQAMQAEGDAAVIAGGILRNNANGHAAFSASGEGTLVYAAGQADVPSTLSWYDRDGNRTPTPAEPVPVRYLSLAPDVSKAAAVIPGETGDGEVWIFDLVRGVRTRLYQSSGDNGSPIWSRTGDRLLFTSQHLNAVGFFARRSDGSGNLETIFAEDQDNILFDWSRDGRYVAYWPMGSGIGTANIWVRSLEDQTSEPVIEGDPRYTAARFSADGRRLAYVSNESGRQEIFVQDLEGPEGMQGGARWQVSTAGGTRPRWRDDGREVVYLDLDQRMTAVSLEERDGTMRIGTPRALFAVDGRITALDATGDHQRFLVATRSDVDIEPLYVILDWTAEVHAQGGAER